MTVKDGLKKVGMEKDFLYVNISEGVKSIVQW